MQLTPFITSLVQCVSHAHALYSSHEFPRYSLAVIIENDIAKCKLVMEPQGYLILRGKELEEVFDVFDVNHNGEAACIESIRHMLPHLAELLRRQNPKCGADLDKLCFGLDQAMTHGILQCVKREWAAELRVQWN